MKNIKNRLSFLIIISLLLNINTSCSSDESDFGGFLSREGAFPKFETVPPSAVGVDTLEDLTYSFTVTDVNGSMDSYTLNLSANLGGSQTAVFEVSTTTSFPAEFNFTATDLATILGVTTADFDFGDTFYFTASAVNNDGVLYDSSPLNYSNNGDEDPSTNTIGGGNTTSDLVNANAGYGQAFVFNFIVLCPGETTSTDLVGLWQITSDDFGVVLDNGVFEIVDGPGVNQVTLLDPFAHVDPVNGNSYNVIMDIDGSTGTVNKQDSWDSGAYGLSYGIGRIDGSGLIFTCVGNGFMSFDFQYTVDAGSFGTFNMQFTKL